MATPSGPSLFVPTIPGRNSCLNLSLAKNALLSRSPSPHSSDPGNFLRHLDHLGLRHRPRQHHLAIPMHHTRLQPLQTRQIPHAFIRLHQIARAADHVLLHRYWRARQAPTRPRPPRRSECRSSAHQVPRQCASGRCCCRSTRADTQQPPQFAQRGPPDQRHDVLPMHYKAQHFLGQFRLVASADQQDIRCAARSADDSRRKILGRPLPHHRADAGMHRHHRSREQRAHFGRNAARQRASPVATWGNTARSVSPAVATASTRRSRSSLTWLCLRRS